MTLQREHELFVSAADSFVELVGRIDSSKWDSPGLGEWDLRALVGHTSRSLITVIEYVDQPVETAELASPEEYYAAVATFASTGTSSEAIIDRGRKAGEALGDDPAGAVGRLRDAALERLADQPDLVMHTILGGMWLQHYLPTRTFELAVHGLDIARAIDVPHTLAPDVLSGAVALAAQVAAHAGEGAPVLLALTGRSPLAQGFSVV